MKRVRRLAALLALIACMLVASACFWSYGRFDPLSKGDAFDDARKHFTRALRWGQLDMAAKWVPKEERQEFLAETRSLGAWRFTDYDIEQVDVDEAFETGTVEVLFHGYATASLREGSFRVQQQWTRDAETGRWQVSPHFLGLDAVRTAAGR